MVGKIVLVTLPPSALAFTLNALFIERPWNPGFGMAYGVLMVTVMFFALYRLRNASPGARLIMVGVVVAAPLVLLQPDHRIVYAMYVFILLALEVIILTREKRIDDFGEFYGLIAGAFLAWWIQFLFDQQWITGSVFFLTFAMVYFWIQRATRLMLEEYAKEMEGI